MCGFAGFFDPRCAGNRGQFAGRLLGMINPLLHRGPDGAGTWIDEQAGIALGHRRLSILELSSAGAQPLTSHDGRFVIAFNGEIYNHLELRLKLCDVGIHPAWRGSSDTETLVEAIAMWGVEATLSQTSGMFAFALWDRRENRLVLARDRLGEKPIYFGWQDGGQPHRTLLFGSELKALKAHPAFQNQIDRAAVHRYLQFGYVPGPGSIFQGIQKLDPATYVTFTSDGASAITRYWTQPMPIAHSNETRERRAWVEELHDTLKSAVKRQMLSDVPLGAFLSGGVDSTTIVALMQAQSSRAVKTFTVGSENLEFNEAHHAMAVAQAIGTDHTAVIATDRDARDIIPQLPVVYDEPFADSSQIPTILVSRLASQSVKVVLSGDGGDELFAGYERYHLANSTFRTISNFPLPLRRVVARLLRNHHFMAIAPKLTGFGGFRGGRKNLHDLILKASEVLDAPSAVALNSRLSFRWQPFENPSLGDDAIGSLEHVLPLDTPDALAHMTREDLTGYLVDNILVKVDRAAMSQSLETRVPMLDPAVIALACRIPMEHKVTPDANKQVLREVLYQYVPRELMNRPKRGFAIPVHEWLRGPLRDWADDLLAAKQLRADGYFDANAIERLWSEHRRGQANHQWKLWPVLMFQAWLHAETGVRRHAPSF